MLTLRRSLLEEARMLHHIQVEAFQDDLAQYQDYATNPACETIDKTLNRITSYDYYTIRLDDQIIGGICTRETAEQEYKISPFFISAKFQNQGFGSKIINLLLAQYPNACLWWLNTPKQDARNCYFYEKLGFAAVGCTTVNANLILTRYQMVI